MARVQVKPRRPAAKPKPRPKRVKVKAKSKALRTRERDLRNRHSYDGAADSADNRKQWALADSLAVNVLNDPATRQLLRDRCRYEVRNNGHAYGMVESLANDLVGSGPRLAQLRIPGVERELTRRIERAWAAWAWACDLAEDLRQLHRARVRDGEGFALLVTNPELAARNPIQLDLALYEADQVADPFQWRHGLDPRYDDGIRHDEAGNPLEYTFLKQHPGGVQGWLAFDTETFPAARVLHWFKPDRPGQSRGIPAIVPGLALLPMLRRYGLAVLAAAETHANLAGVLKTNLAPAAGNVRILDEVEIPRNALLTLPADWEASAFHGTQPVPQYGEYRTEVLSEIGRPALVPRNVMTGSSAEYNFSSLRADRLLYQDAIGIERERMERRILDRILVRWFAEAQAGRAPIIPAGLPPLWEWEWEWFWPGFFSVDPVKDAQAEQIELANGTLTRAEILARKGRDVEEHFRALKLEQDLRRELQLDDFIPAGNPSQVPPDAAADSDDPSQATRRPAAAR